MRYVETPPPPKHNGGIWFGHEIHLILLSNREEELFEALEAIGPKGVAWRMGRRPARENFLFFNKERFVRFARRDQAMRFKLIWDEDEDTGRMPLWSFNMNWHNFLYPSIRSSGRPLTSGPSWKLPDSMVRDWYAMAARPAWSRERLTFYDKAKILTTSELEERLSQGGLFNEQTHISGQDPSLQTWLDPDSEAQASG